MIRIGANIRIIPQGSYTPEELKAEFKKLELAWTLTNMEYCNVGSTKTADLYSLQNHNSNCRPYRISYENNRYQPGTYKIASAIVTVIFSFKKTRIQMTGLVHTINQTSIEEFKKDITKAKSHYLMWLKSRG